MLSFQEKPAFKQRVSYRSEPKAAGRTVRQGKGAISEHIKHIFVDGELEESSVVRYFRTTDADGKQYEVAYCNLDMVLALGSRVRSKVGV